MLVIRLTKIGKKHSPDFRLIVNEKRTPPRSGKYLELLGNYNPAQNKVNLKKERIAYWLSKGVKPSVTAHNLLVKAGILNAKKLPKHKIIRRKEEAVPVEKPAEQKSESTEKKEETPSAGKQTEQKAEPEEKKEERTETIQEAKGESPKEEAGKS